jgi:hypothetical protein
MNIELKDEKAQVARGLSPQWDEELSDANLMPPQIWPEPGYNVWRYAEAGVRIGILAGCTSLVVNVIGSVLWPTISGEAQHPLRLIQIYLTFPLGESALQLNSGVALAAGCILYLATGMLYGMLFVLSLSYFLPRTDMWARLVACSVLALFVWTTNFYLILSWLQPLLFGGRWINDMIPWWVAAGTHLVFGWTVAMLYPELDSTHVRTASGKPDVA